MQRLVPSVVRHLAVVCCAGALWASSPRLAQADDAPVPALTAGEREAVVREIAQMVQTDERRVVDFAVREATPDRIERLYHSPDLAQLPKNIRENGLIFAGRGSSLLTFERPSDVIAKISSWFPDEIARARAAAENRKNLWRGDVNLWGPFENWDAEPAAFLALWNCMPQSAWLRPDRNPFEVRLSYSLPLYPMAARSSAYGEFDFGFCVRERSGYRPAWTEADIGPNAKRLLLLAERATPVLERKFAHFLAQHRCRGTGPDDCVLVLRLWASLSPADPALAAATQSLEAEIAPDAPLPELRRPFPGWAESDPRDGQDRFDAGLRRAAYLRAKLLSVLAAPAAWPPDALAATLRQMTKLRQAFADPFVARWYQYEIDYRNDPINPWRVLPADLAQRWPVRTAILAELATIAGGDACAVLQQWFDHGGPSLKTEYVLDRLRHADPHAGQCARPDFAWLRQQDADGGDFRFVLYGYLALLPYLPEAERTALTAGLTDGGALCRDRSRTAASGWLQSVCARWAAASRPPHARKGRG